MNPTASKLVKKCLSIWNGTSVEETILRYFNALFERFAVTLLADPPNMSFRVDGNQDIQSISRVGSKWPEVLPQICSQNPDFFKECLPFIEQRFDSSRMKPPERVTLILMMAEFFVIDANPGKAIILHYFSILKNYLKRSKRKWTSCGQLLPAKYQMKTSAFGSP